MKHLTSMSRRALALTAACVTTFGLAGAATITVGLASAGAAVRAPQAKSVTFTLHPSPGIAACLPHAGGTVTITPGSQNDTMKVSVHGMPVRGGMDLFVIQDPAKPFGIAWYQTDVNVNKHGTGTATAQGIFDKETFSVSLGEAATFPPTHQFFLGLWFSNPQVPFNLGCEPGQVAPVITPFNGEQHAGVQAFNTGPLTKVNR